MSETEADGRGILPRTVGRLDGTGGIWLVTVAMAAAGGLLYALAIRHLAPVSAPLAIPWWALAIGFAAAELFVVHIQYGRDAQSYSLSELPLVLGLCFGAPASLALARLVGAGAALTLGRRQSGLKLAFNLSAFLLIDGVVAPLLFFAILGGASPVAPRGWLAVFVAVLVTDLLSALVIGLATFLHQGSLPARRFGRDLLFGTTVAVANSSLALLTVAMLWSNASLVWLLGIVAIMLFFAYRGHVALQRMYTRLTALWSCSRTVGGLAGCGEESLAAAILERARELLLADLAELILEPSDSEEDPQLLRVHDSEWQGRRLAREPAAEAPPLLAHLVAANRGVLLSLATDADALRSEMERLHLRSGAVAPLRLSQQIHGALLVGRTQSAATSFTSEDLRSLETLAASAAVAFQNERHIDELRREAAEREHQALHDELTRLANRTLFERQVAEALATGPDEGTLAVLLLDLNDFKDVNDTFGHSTGDELLCRVAGIIGATLPPQARLARLGGDEFAVLLSPLDGRSAAAEHATQILRGFEDLVGVGGIRLEVRTSIGIAVWPDHGSDVATLLRHADMAMYAAKETHSGYEYFAPEHDRCSPRRLTLLADLKEAVEAHRITLAFQPQYALRDDRLCGIEVLARFEHPDFGSVPPEEFIPLAEHTGLIVPLTLGVIADALRAAQRWKLAERGLRLSVNLSVRCLLHGSFAASVERLARQLAADPRLLTFEVTESSIMRDPDKVFAELWALQQLGSRISVDDFGTGYSSIAYLRRIGADELKIDKSFLAELVTDVSAQRILAWIISLGRELDLEVVVEGVETADTLECLRALRCPVVQGYLLGRPMREPDLLRLLAREEDRAREALEPTSLAPVVPLLRPALSDLAGGRKN